MEIKKSHKKILFLFSSILLFVVLGFLLKQFLYERDYTKETFNIKGSNYDATQEIEVAFKNLNRQRSQASKISGVRTKEKIVAITFDDFTESWAMTQILQLLNQYSAKATFFIPGIKGAEDAALVKQIRDENHEIGNYTLSATRQMELLSEEALIKDFSRSGVILREITGERPTMLKANATEYTQSFLEVANACGIDTVVDTKHILNYKSFTSYEMARGYISKIDGGSIISIKLAGYLGESEYEASKKEETPAIDKKPSISIKGEKEAKLSEEEQLLQVIHWVLEALEEIGYRTEAANNLQNFRAYAGDTQKSTNTFREPSKQTEVNNQEFTVQLSNYQELREMNQGRLAEIVNNLYTTQSAVSYIFRGVSNPSTVDHILKVLDEMDAKATFFVTGKEILLYPATIENIVAKGHSLGNGGLGAHTKNPSLLSYEEISYEIEAGERILKDFLKERYGARNKYYMPLYADTKGFVLEAASALGYEHVIMYNRNPILSAYRDLGADAIFHQYYRNVISLHRGDIIYFRLDYLTNPQTMEELVLKTADQLIEPAGYHIVSVDELVTSPLVYTPAPRDTDNSLIKPTYNYSESILDNKIFHHYIGNPSIRTAETLKGFMEEEIERIDHTGKINTEGDPVIFLTFDDWGSDIIINQILSVLNKYNVKASFFIRVGNDKLPYESSMPNPNLLRAIALEGHDIGNHTFSHKQVNITEESEKEALVKDILVAHHEMARYIGDLDEFKLLFRPPTLAVSKLGLTSIFDMGYPYVVNGDFSTKDYIAPSLDFLVSTLKNGINTQDFDRGVDSDTPEEYIRKIGAGSIVVMHLTDESRYTPEALDMIIPYYLDQGYRFEKLSTYLENNHKNTPKGN